MRSWERRLEQFDRDLEHRAGPDRRLLRGPRAADRAGRPRLPVAGHELMMAPSILRSLAHLEWLGFVQPTGLVVSAPALVRAGAILDRRDADGQQRLRECVDERRERWRDAEPVIADFEELRPARARLELLPEGLRRDRTATRSRPELEVPLPDYGETLRPDFAVRERDPGRRRDRRGSCSFACSTRR